MAHREKAAGTVVMDFDPSGSIFLPKTDRPEEEFERIRQQILFERGNFHGLNLAPEEIDALLLELESVRNWHMGRVAVLS